MICFRQVWLSELVIDVQRMEEMKEETEEQMKQLEKQMVPVVNNGTSEINLSSSITR